MRTITTTLLALVFIPQLAFAASPAMRTPSPPTLQTSTASARLYDLAAREAQYRALLSMPKVDIQYTPAGRVELLEGSTAMFASLKELREGDKPIQLMRQLGPLLMATPAD